MNKKQKLIKAMEHESISAKEALETAIDMYTASPELGYQEVVFKAVIYALVMEGKVYTAITGKDIPETPNDVVPGATYDSFELRALQMEDGAQMAVALTDNSNMDQIPNTAFAELELEELMDYIEDTELDGLLLNPGPKNFFMPMSLVRGLVQQWRMIKKQFQKR